MAESSSGAGGGLRVLWGALVPSAREFISRVPLQHGFTRTQEIMWSFEKMKKNEH
jgi:hypothetical protein